MPKLRTLIVLALLLMLPTSVWAHAEMVGSEPADGEVLATAPEQIRVYFNEPIEAEFFALDVYASTGGAPIDLGDDRLSPTDARILEVSLPPLGRGTYTVVWRALSLDSHPVNGVFAFTVGAGSAPGRPLDFGPSLSVVPFAWTSGLRWLTFILSFLLLGGFAVYPIVLHPALRYAGAPAAPLDAVLRRRWLLLAAAALALLLITGFAALVFQAAEATGTPLDRVLGGRALTRVLTATRWGMMWLLRTTLLVAIVGALAWLAATARPSARPWLTGALLSAAALLTLSASGHPSGVPRAAAAAILFDWTHLLAGGLWVGGLVMLGLFLVLLRTAAPEDRRVLLGTAVPRFSILAGASVVVLIATGIYAGLLYIPSWAALEDTQYGVLLSSKLVLFVPLLLLGAVNLLIMHPRFRRQLQASRHSASDDRGYSTFGLLVLGEVVLAVGVLGITAVLTGTSPARSLPTEGKAFRGTHSFPLYDASFVVTPNQAGQNRLIVSLTGPPGGVQPDAQAVHIRLTMLDMEMGVREVLARRIGPGRFEAEGSHLSMSGNWQATVTVRRPNQDGAARFDFAVGQPPNLNRPAFSPARIASNMLNPRTFAALIALVGAVALWILTGLRRRRLGQLPSRVAAGGLLALGLLLGGVSLVEAYRVSMPRPVPSGPASVARGQEVYLDRCAICHGPRGRGDGPQAIALDPKPADFRVHMAAGHTDEQLFYWVTNGLDGTAMPGFKDTLSEEDRWHVINFIRTFAPVAQ